jgi:hypothetical protein
MYIHVQFLILSGKPTTEDVSQKFTSISTHFHIQFTILQTSITDTPLWLTSSCERYALRASEMLCSLWAGTPGNRSILLPRRGEVPGNTSEVALTASSSVTFSESFKIDVSWFAAKKKVSILNEDL